MAKITLTDLTSGYKAIAPINANNNRIESHLNDLVLYRDNPGGEDNYMLNDLDMNSYRILNIAAPEYPTDLVRLQDIGALEEGLEGYFVTLAGDETITGSKDFTGDVLLDGTNINDTFGWCYLFGDTVL